MEIKNIGRRKALSAIGSSVLGLSAMSSLASAKETSKYEQQYRTARRIREVTGKHRLFISYLQNRGWNVGTTRKLDRVSLAPQNDGKPSTQKLEKSSLQTDMTLSHYYADGTDFYYLDYHFSWDDISSVFETNGNGQGGVDHISLAGHPDHWYVNDGDWYDDGGSELFKKETDWSGVDFGFRDGKELYYGWQSYSGAVGTRLRPRPTSEDRLVRAEYNHTWGGARLSGFSITIGPFGISFSNSANKTWESGVHVAKE